MYRAITVFAAVICAGAFAAIAPAAHASTASRASTAAAKCVANHSSRPAPSSQHGAQLRQIPKFPDGQTCEWEVAGNYPYADWGGTAQTAMAYCKVAGQNLVRLNPGKIRDYKCTDFPSLQKVVLSVEVCTQDENGNFLGTWWVSTNSGMVFEVGHSNTSDGATVDQWPFNGTDTQYWLPVQVDDTYDVLVNVNSGKCLGVGGGSTSWQAPVVQWTCNGNPDQKWAFSFTGNYASNGNPVYNLVDLNSQLCLDVPNSSTSQGTALWQYGCNGTSAQGWF